MAVGYAPRLPLVKSTEDGDGLLKNIRSLTQQNLKMLILTSPGERMMDPNYGVGLRKYLFEQDTPDLKTNLRNKITRQAGIYMPYLEIRSVVILTPGNIENMAENSLQVRVSYAVPGINNVAFLDIDITHSNRI